MQNAHFTNAKCGDAHSKNGGLSIVTDTALRFNENDLQYPSTKTALTRS
jgi:hypothetical protein